jgi:hypothetical protein
LCDRENDEFLYNSLKSRITDYTDLKLDQIIQIITWSFFETRIVSQWFPGLDRTQSTFLAQSERMFQSDSMQPIYF